MPTFVRAFFPGCFLTMTLVWAAACDSGAASEALSVDQVLSNPTGLSGQRVRVRGWRSFYSAETLIGCPAQHPCCNSAWGVLALTADPSGRKQGIGVPDLSCTGNECAIHCSPFDPTLPAYELVGVLKPITDDPRFNGYDVILTDIDWTASSQLTGSGDLMRLPGESIRTGIFIVSRKNH